MESILNIDESGNKIYKNTEYVLHREDGPAIELTDGTKKWYINGELHRKDGAAIEWSDGVREYWVDGKFVKKVKNESNNKKVNKYMKNNVVYKNPKVLVGFGKERNTKFGKLLSISFNKDKVIEILKAMKERNGTVDINIKPKRKVSENGVTHYAEIAPIVLPKVVEKVKDVSEMTDDEVFQMMNG
jgi:hypothetical protein